MTALKENCDPCKPNPPIFQVGAQESHVHCSEQGAGAVQETRSTLFPSTQEPSDWGSREESRPNWGRPVPSPLVFMTSSSWEFRLRNVTFRYVLRSNFFLLNTIPACRNVFTSVYKMILNLHKQTNRNNVRRSHVATFAPLVSLLLSLCSHSSASILRLKKKKKCF